MLVVEDETETLLPVHESLLVVADGVSGTRGSLEEKTPGTHSGIRFAGVYDESSETSEALVALPSWTDLEVRGSLSAGTRVLDLRSGVLWRYRTTEGGAPMRTARWSCLARPGTSVLVADGHRSMLTPGHGLKVVDVPTSLGGGVKGVIETSVEATGSHVTVARLASYVARGDGVPSMAEVSARHDAARRAGPTDLLREQTAAWADRWSVADVEVTGDPELTLAARFALFHLVGAVADRGEAAVGARGLSGDAYAGHVFWDADVFVLPVLAASHPESARAIIEYRIRRLAAARRSAAQRGRRGARFPWESAHDGSDVTPRSGVDGHGDVIPIRTGGLEEHITADVAWAAWQLAAWTGRWEFLEDRGRRLLIDTARYWTSRVRFDANGQGHIDGVIGPDEYHENVDDNAFTNGMAAWNLRRAIELVERDHGSPDAREAGRWRAVADALVDGYDPISGRHRQFVGFEDLEPLSAHDVGPTPAPADVILGHERVARSQIIKQADVLMLHHLIPEAMPAGALARDMDFYLPRTSHGSSLSPAVHASLLARLGRLDEALALLDFARGIDLEDRSGTTAGGLHLAALAGLWHALVFGFAGVRVGHPDDRDFVVDPRIPERWIELGVRVRWHGCPIRLRCRTDRVHVETDTPVHVRVGGAPPVEVCAPGRWIELPQNRTTP